MIKNTKFETVQLHSLIHVYINQLIKIASPNVLLLVKPTYIQVQYFFDQLPPLQLNHLQRQAHVHQTIQQGQHAALVHKFDAQILYIPSPSAEKELNLVHGL